jgi:hypothetical protein
MSYKMNEQLTSKLAVEAIVKDRFGLQLSVKQLVTDDIPVSHTAVASVFLTPKHQLFALLHAKGTLTLGDVEKMAKKMGLVVDEYLPPHHDNGYFNDRARDRFKEIFPGRHTIDETELRFYRKLVPYNPALLRIGAVKDGLIRQFDAHDSSEWRVAAKFAYKQITAL